MSFNNRFISFLRILLFPVSVLYGCVIHVRNFLFNKKILSSTRFDLPIICIGNLSVGGTGKTPMVEYLIKILQQQNLPVATISRGYRRKTKGFLLANESATVEEIGDEPMQFYNKFPDIKVCVDEDRTNAVKQLMKLNNETQAIILDDAFQHRKIKAGLNILLTDYNNLFYKDYFLPTGNLRDQRNSSKRADIIVVTKCPVNISTEEEQLINQAIKHSGIFFTTINCANPYHINTSEEFGLDHHHHYILIHGIANADSLRNYIGSFDKNFDEIKFEDHHYFTQNDIQKITTLYKQQTTRTIIITTEKDAVKLKKFEKKLIDLPLYVLPIETKFLFNEEEVFNNEIKSFITQFNKK